MIFGYRMEAIAILGREVMQPRGLIGLGCDTVDYCGSEIAHVSHGYGYLSRAGASLMVSGLKSVLLPVSLSSLGPLYPG